MDCCNENRDGSDDGTEMDLEATKMSKVLPNSSIINSTMVLVQKPEKKKARLCACGNELRGKEARLLICIVLRSVH